jgi:putative protein-disulfide isomerase
MEGAKFFYFYDALCGWCYGFSKVMQGLYADHHKDYAFETVSGGMVTADRIGPIGPMAAYISEAHKQVEELSGVKFGDPFVNGVLKEGTAVFSSVEPARALTYAKKALPERSLQFASALQSGIYQDGRIPTDLKWYNDLADQFGLEQDGMQEALHDKGSEDSDFNMTQQFGVKAFPTLVLYIEGSYYLIAKGYTPRESIDRAMASVWASLG